MSSSVTGRESGEVMMVEVDCGSVLTVAESMTLEASQLIDAGAPALTMADSWVRCVAVSIRSARCRCASAAVSESPHGRATRLPVPMARMRAAESWATSLEVLPPDDGAVALADGEAVLGEDGVGDEDSAAGADGSAEAEGLALDDPDESSP